jgi:hypothetical protein
MNLTDEDRSAAGGRFIVSMLSQRPSRARRTLELAGEHVLSR